MYRKTFEDLKVWLDSPNRKPLIIRGARQVGKSSLVRLFCQENSKLLFEVDLERHSDLARAFLSKDPETILREVGATKKDQSATKSDLIFFDEIQGIPAAIPTLRYFYEDMPELPIISAGSLLEFAIERSVGSMPVGRIQYLHLGPMTFTEFLLALGESNLIEILEAYKLGDSIGDIAHKRFTKLQREYLFVGGMPEVVNAYSQNSDLKLVSQIQRSIVETYREDFPKYGESRDHQRMLQVFNFAARNIGQKIKYSSISQNFQSSTLKRDIELLTMARIVTKIVHSDSNGTPLLAEANEKKYKLLFLDVGLANNLIGLDWTQYSKIENSELVNEGSLAEQFIGQHLLDFQSNQTNRNLTYWLREGKSNNAEVDYVVSFGGKIIPIEVKSGTSGKLKSLHQFVGEKKVDAAIRFDMNPPSVQTVKTKFNKKGELKPVEYNLYSFPLYLVEKACQLMTTI